MASILDLVKSQGARGPSLGGLLTGNFFQEEEDELDPAAPTDDRIIVEGRPPFQPSEIAPTLGEPAPVARPPLRSFEEEFGPAFTAPERKGRFGIGGTLRDVLGTLGDAFLVQSGNKPLYHPRRMQEREADAMVGFSRNPLKAIERLAQENPEAAREMYEKYQRDALGQDELAFKRDQFEVEAPDREALRMSRTEQARQRVLGNARTAIASVQSPAQWAALRPRLQERLQDAGLGEWADLIPEGFDPDVQYLFMDPKDLAAMEDRDALRAQQMAIAKLRDRRQAAGQSIQRELGTARIADSRERTKIARERLEKGGNSKRSFNFGAPPADVAKPKRRFEIVR